MAVIQLDRDRPTDIESGMRNQMKVSKSCSKAFLKICSKFTFIFHSALFNVTMTVSRFEHLLNVLYCNHLNLMVTSLTSQKPANLCSET